MKLAEAIKKYNFLKKLDLPDRVLLGAANHLEKLKQGSSEIYLTPLAKACDPIMFLVEWDFVFKANKHRMNSTLLDMELGNRSKFGPRSIALPWAERVRSLKEHYSNQDDSHVPKYKKLLGEANLAPVSIKMAAEAMKSSTSAGFPFLCKKGKVINELVDNFDTYLKRKDPCALFTRTAESKKTRNVWGYPFADTLFEMAFYLPILWYQKEKYSRAALVSPDLVAERVTEIMLKARTSNRIIYSVDFSSFDSSVKYQYIDAAFEYFASCFAPMFTDILTHIGRRIYSIPIVTPNAVFRGKHGVPSGSTFTNEIDSVVQLMIALSNNFISELECLIQGDDGIYIMTSEEVEAFEAVFSYAGLKINLEKSCKSSDYTSFCQNLFHIDYMKDGLIGGIYPTYRAINRILFQERFVNFKKDGISGRDYYGIRCLSILENCKYHPLFEELVEFVLAREKFLLDISEDGLTKYCSSISHSSDVGENLKHQHGTDVTGIKDFAAYKVAQKILASDRLDHIVRKDLNVTAVSPNPLNAV